MDYIELSLNDLKEKSVELANQIKIDYEPDLIIYIAKGGYLIGKYISESLNVMLIPVYAERRTNGFKSVVSPLLQVLPNRIKLFFRSLELKSGVHAVVKKRDVHFKSEDLESLGKVKKILLVDDSVDTGSSVLSIIEEMGKLKISVEEIRVAALNVWGKSTGVVKVAYWIFRDTIIITPMSNDSRYHNDFLELYNNR